MNGLNTVKTLVTTQFVTQTRQTGTAKIAFWSWTTTITFTRVQLRLKASLTITLTWLQSWQIRRLLFTSISKDNWKQCILTSPSGSDRDGKEISLHFTRLKMNSCWYIICLAVTKRIFPWNFLNSKSYESYWQKIVKAIIITRSKIQSDLLLGAFE